MVIYKYNAQSSIIKRRLPKSGQRGYAYNVVLILRGFKSRSVDKYKSFFFAFLSKVEEFKIEIKIFLCITENNGVFYRPSI